MTPEQKESINKFLTEWMGPKFEAWPDGSVKRFLDIDYFTDSGFFRIWNKAKESEEWWGFWAEKLISVLGNELKVNDTCVVVVDLIGPKFVEKWASFLGWEEE